jgi:hypothetical protein
MAAIDLSDHDIDQLLSSAELSLAGKPADQSVRQARALTAPKTPSPSTALVGKAIQDTTGKKEPLALRVPQLKSKDKKVRADINFPPAFLMRKFYPKLQ